jgi:hypothetical protein
VHEQQGSFRVPEFYSAAGRRVAGTKTTRTLSISGEIRLHGAGRRAATGQAQTRSAFDDRGHLIADQFGGPSGERSGNIVPMHALINQAGHPWSAMESTVRELLGAGTGEMTVRCTYDDDSVRPVLFRVSVRCGRVLRDWTIANYNPYLS